MRTHWLCTSKSCLSDSLASGRKQILRNRLAKQQFAWREICGGIKILHLGGISNPAAIRTREVRFADAGTPVARSLPQGLRANPCGGHCSNSSDDDSLRVSHSPYFCL